MHKSAPFLRWAGGKRWFTHKIESYLPDNFTDYYEPFLGGGAIFFWLMNHGYLNNQVFLSDFNEDLIGAYNAVKVHANKLCSDLEAMHFDENEYYLMRDKYNSRDLGKYEQGLAFIYLNLTGFNGIYRVSRKGKYNVPYGFRGKYSDELFNLLKSDSLALKQCNLKAQSFEVYLNPDFHFKEGSLVFLDPPYTVSHNNNGFIAYNKNLFDLDHQFVLRQLLDKINEEKSYFIMTNAHHEVIQDIFDGYYFFEEERASVIGGTNANRGRIQEYIVRNF